MHQRAIDKLAEIEANYVNDGHDVTDVWPLTKGTGQDLVLAARHPRFAQHMDGNLHGWWWERFKEAKTHADVRQNLHSWNPSGPIGAFWKAHILSELEFNDELAACQQAKTPYKPASYLPVWSEANDHTPQQAIRQLCGLTRLQAWRSTMMGVAYDWTALLDHQTWFCANLDSWVADAEQAGPLGKLLRHRPAMLAHSLSNLIYDSCHPPLGGKPADLSLYPKLEPLITKLWGYSWDHARTHGKLWMEHLSEVADIWQQITGKKLANAPIYVYKPVGERRGWAAPRSDWQL